MRLFIALLNILLLHVTQALGQVPRVAPESCGVTMESLSASLFIDTLPESVEHRVRFVDITDPHNLNELPGLSVKRLRYFTPAHVKGIGYNRIYQVAVDAKTQDGWTTGGQCVLYAPAFPHSRIVPSNCGTTLKALNDQLLVQHVPAASDYEFRIEDMNGTLLEETNPRHPTPHFYTPSWSSAIQFGQRYRFFARARVNGAWRAHYGPGCVVAMPSFPPTTIKDCGRELSSTSELIQAVPIAGATGYEFEVRDLEDPTKKATLLRRHRNFWFFHLSWKPFRDLPIQSSHRYSVRVRGLRGTVTGPWSDDCELRTPHAE